MSKMIESLASEISKLKVERHLGKGRVPNTFAPRNPNPNPYRRTNEQLQILQRNKDANEDQRVKAMKSHYSMTRSAKNGMVKLFYKL